MSRNNSGIKTFPGVMRSTWGIFDIAYVPIRLSVLPRLSIGTIHDASILTWHMFKLIFEVYRSSGLNTILFILCHVWLCTSPAISLHLAFRTLQSLDATTLAEAVSGRHNPYRFWATCWFLSAALTTFVHRKHNALTNCLAGHLRARILPRLARASLRLDMQYGRTSLHDSAFQIDSCHFGSVPEMDIFRSFFTRLSDILRVLLELRMVVWILYQTKDHTARIYVIVGICMIIFSTNSPTNWIGGAGYTFWTTHPAYHKLHALYSMIFEIGYRETICKDGLANRLEEEFMATSNILGPHDIDTWRLASYVEPIPWYWELGQGMILENPMLIFAAIASWSFPTSALLSIVLIQYGTGMLRADFRRMHSGLTLGEIMKKSKTLYETIDEVQNERIPTAYPTSTSDDAGMKISFKHVFVTYKGGHETRTINAVIDVSVDIEPGQLVVIVGQNGSGKSSLLKLLPATMQPSSGDVYIDDKLITEYDINQVRNAIAILSQDERMFPLSLRDNMLMGLTERAWRLNSQEPQHSTEKLVERASRLGGSWDIMRNVGLDTVLDPVRVIRQSTECVGNGKVARAAYDELDRCAATVKPVKISGGERQRLLATRLITRILDNNDIKLIVVDEPSSALDPIAERDLFKTFMQMRKGRTVIFVTHRFKHLVDHADLILCMANGKVVERGTHPQLLQASGEYARLYNAQVQGSDKY